MPATTDLTPEELENELRVVNVKLTAMHEQIIQIRDDLRTETENLKAMNENLRTALEDLDEAAAKVRTSAAL